MSDDESEKDVERVREYLEMATEGKPRVVEYAETFDVPEGTVDVYVGVDGTGHAYWIVKGARLTNLYSFDRHPNIESVVKAHADVLRRTLNREGGPDE